MVKDINPIYIGVAGLVLSGVGYAQLNPTTQALMVQRDMVQGLQQAAVMESQTQIATQLIAESRQNCTAVPSISEESVYRLPDGTAICDSKSTATVINNKPMFIAQKEVK